MDISYYDGKLNELIFTALGEASMCWSEIPKGEFDATHATKIGIELHNDILKLLQELRINEKV